MAPKTRRTAQSEDPTADPANVHSTMAPKTRRAAQSEDPTADPSNVHSTIAANEQNAEGHNSRITSELTDLEADEFERDEDNDNDNASGNESGSAPDADLATMSPTSLSQVITDEKAKVRVLMQSKERRRLASKATRLRKQRASLEQGQSSDHGSSSDDDSPAPKRRRSMSYRKKLIRDPETYKGKSEREYLMFVGTCTMAFEHDQLTFKEDFDKVAWAQQFLDKEPRDRWMRWREDNPKRRMEVTWKFFCDFLHDLLADPRLRMSETYEKYQAMVQKPSQTPREFLTVLEDLERRMPVFTMPEEHKLWAFHAKLLPELRKKLTNHSIIPKTRDELVSLAMSLDRTLVLSKGSREKAYGSSSAGIRTKGPKAHLDRPEQKEDHSGGGQKRSARRFDRKRKRFDQDRRSSQDHGSNKRRGHDKPSSSISCYNCGKAGHYSRNCPDRPSDKKKDSHSEKGKA